MHKSDQTLPAGFARARKRGRLAVARPRGLAGLDVLVGAGLALSVLVLYTATLLPGLGSRDTAEFQWVAPTLGLAHPTGYPLYTILGWLWCQLPLGGTPAWRMNLFSAAAGAAAIGVTYAVARALGQPRPVAAAAAAALAVSRAFWSQATIAEVYALAALIQALLLLALLRWRAGRWPLWPAGLLLGLGLAHHRSIVLLAPGALLFVLLAYRARAKEQAALARRRGWLPAAANEVLLTLVALLAALLLYLYVPLRAPGWMQSWRQVADHISGASLTATWLDPGRLRAEHVHRVLDLAGRFVWPQFLPAGAALALLGALGLARRDRADAALLLMGYALVCAFCAAYYVDDIEVFFIPAHQLAALLLGEGALLLAALAQGIRACLRSYHQGTKTPRFDGHSSFQERKFASRGIRILVVKKRLRQLLSRLHGKPRSQPGLLALRVSPGWLLLALPALLLWHNLPAVRALNTIDDERIAREVMAQPLPHGALVIGDWYATEGPHYLQVIENLRPDLQFGSSVGRAALLDALDHGRAVYLTAPDLSLGLAQAPEGRLWRLSRTPLAMLNNTEFRWQDGVALTGYTLPPGVYRPGAAVPVMLQWQALVSPQGAYTFFIHLVGPDGRIQGQQDQPPAQAPTDRWQPGKRYADLVSPTLAADAPPGRYRVTLGWYAAASMQRLPLADGSADYITLGDFEVASP